METKPVKKPHLVKNVTHQTEALHALFECMFSFYGTEDVVDKKFWLEYISTISDLCEQSKTLYYDIVIRVFNQFEFNKNKLKFEFFCRGLYNLHKAPKQISEQYSQNEEVEPTIICLDQGHPLQQKLSPDDSKLNKHSPLHKPINPAKTYGRMTFIKTVTLDEIQKSLHHYALLLDSDPKSLEFDTGLSRDQLIEKFINYITTKTPDKNIHASLCQIEKIVGETIQIPRIKSAILKIIIPIITKKIDPEFKAERRSSSGGLTPC